MNISLIVFIVLALYVCASMFFVYRLRGNVRFESFRRYLRKGWFIFAPFNCWLYLFTQKRAAVPIMDIKDFKELDPIKDNWEVIRDEAVNLKSQGFFEKTKDPASVSFYDIGFRTFYKYGWGKFYLQWYGYTHKSAQDLCPKTVEVLSKVPSVKGALFSFLPAGSQLTPHSDPSASSLRYHLGLDVPASDKAYINVDGVSYSWRNGEAFLFDETYLHFAKNETDKDRLILMCEIERPMSFPGRMVNFFYQLALRFGVVPNQPGDEEGLINRIFSSMDPIIVKVRTYKESNPLLYEIVWGAIRLALLLSVCAALYFLFSGLEYIFSGLRS